MRFDTGAELRLGVSQEQRELEPCYVCQPSPSAFGWFNGRLQINPIYF